MNDTNKEIIPKKSKAYIQSLFEVARVDNNVKKYKKVSEVFARPAIDGEKIITIINGEEETVNIAGKNDVVIQSLGKNKEEYIIDEYKFQDRYDLLENEDNIPEGFKRYRSKGFCYAFKYSGESVHFIAPWGEDMLLKDGDYIVSTDLYELDDIYRIEKDVFKETYVEDKN